jgi:hypothetical protein
MASPYPPNFPSEAITKLIEEIPQPLADKHFLAIQTLKNMCWETRALASQSKNFQTNCLEHFNEFLVIAQVEPETQSNSHINADQEQNLVKQQKNFNSKLSSKGTTQLLLHVFILTFNSST